MGDCVELEPEPHSAQSWLYGKVIGLVEPPAVALDSSQGYETPSSKLLMRWSVLASDLAGLP